MAASTESGVRVRLNFDDNCRYVCESALYKSFWFLVNLDRLKTIGGLALEICSRFDIGSNLRIELSLDGCLLPHWETTAILRDNDIVSVAAVEEAVNKKRKSSGSDWERSVTSANNRKIKKKRKGFEEREENDLAPVVAEPKEKKRRNEVKNREIVEEDVPNCGGTDGSKPKRNRYKKQIQDTEISDLSDFPHAPNFVQSSAAIKSRSCLMSSSENLTLEPNRLQPEQTGTDGVTRNEQTDGSPFVCASASALVGGESGFGKNVVVRNGVEEGNSQLNEFGLAVDSFLGEVKKKARRTRRSRKNRKEKNRALADPELKSSNLVFPHTLELPSKDVPKRSFQWQKMDLAGSKTSAYSHPQHIVFHDDDDDPDSRAPDGQNFSIGGVTDDLLNRNMAEGAERVPEGLIVSKDEAPGADKGMSSFEPKRNCHPAVHSEEQVPQLAQTTSRSTAGSLLESASVEGRGFSCQLMHTTSDSRGLSHEQKPRQIRPATDVSPFANVQVFKRQRGTKFQSSSTAEPVLTSKGNQIRAPSCTKRQMAEAILDAKTSEATKDYSLYELLMGPPRPGDVIAYKILQLSADYSPVLSSYKEAKVLKFAPATRIVELEPKNLQIPSEVKKSTGRFDLTIEDDNEILTNSLMEDDKLVSISWDLLLEPRLVA